MKEMLFNKSAAVAALNQVEGFNPVELARKIGNEGQEEQLYLDVKYRKLWFRLVHPAGKVISSIVNLTETMAIVEARVYLDKADSGDNYIANSFSQKFRSQDPQFGDKFLELAETAAIGRALADAGFGLQFADVGEENDPTQVDAGIPVQFAGNMVQNQGQNSVQSASQVPPQNQMQQPAYGQPQNHMMGQFYQQAQANGSMIGQPAGFQQSAPYTGAMSGNMQQNTMPAGNQNMAQPAPLDGNRPVEELERTMTYEQAVKVVVNFGQNKGKTMGQIAIDSPSYMNWFANEYKGNNHLIPVAARVILKKAMPMAG